MYATRGIAAIAFTALIACGRSTPNVPSVRPSQAAYVWQRNWTPGVRDAVAHPPAGLDGLHVLIAEVSSAATLTTMAVDADSLAAAHVPITLVVRIEGSRPIADLSLDPVVRSADALRAAGVDVIGIEIDHDCATARLDEYARWLVAQRLVIGSPLSSTPTPYRGSITIATLPYRLSITAPLYRSSITAPLYRSSITAPLYRSSITAPLYRSSITAPLYRLSITALPTSAPAGAPDDRSSITAPLYRLSITALPTWASSSALIDVARAVDEIVVQVHAVRAPLIFDANTAWRDLSRFARAIETSTPRATIAASSDTHKTPSLRVALPTYSAVVRDVEVSVDPADVDAFVHRLATAPIAGVGGIVWFRLPVDGDEQTWSRATFARIVARDRVARDHVARDPVAAARTDARARVELVAQGDQRFDVVVSNPSDALVEMPPVHIAGDIDAADMVMGYRELGSGRWEAPRRSLARNERVVIGWIHGKDLALVD